MSVEEVLVYTRLAADTVGATKMDRPEDVETSPLTGSVYVACTNNSDRGNTAAQGGRDRGRTRATATATATSSRSPRPATTPPRRSRWNLLLVAATPRRRATYFSGFPADQVSPISCPDNLAFDAEGNLWISTDGQPSTIGKCDGLFKVPLDGPPSGVTSSSSSRCPREAETCGPSSTPRTAWSTCAVQHPGEDGTFDAPALVLPGLRRRGRHRRAGDFGGPRPTVVQVYRGRR